jgi:hypothetical protein
MDVLPRMHIITALQSSLQGATFKGKRKFHHRALKRESALARAHFFVVKLTTRFFHAHFRARQFTHQARRAHQVQQQ